MKKLLTLSLIILSISAYSQSTANNPDNQLVQEGKTWNVVECINWGGCGTHSLKVMGDTTINQVDYKILHASYDTNQINWFMYGGLREIDDRVYFYLFANETEELLYDFNLAVGENFISTQNSIEYQGCPIEIELSLVDTVTIESGEQRQRFIFSNGEEWIFGIGSLYGLLYVGVQTCVFDMFYELSCCHEADILIYNSSIFQECIVNTVGLDDRNEYESIIYPNPASSHITLSNPNATLQLHTLHGQLILTSSPGDQHISLEGVTPGVYVATVMEGEKVIGREKLVVK